MENKLKRVSLRDYDPRAAAAVQADAAVMHAEIRQQLQAREAAVFQWMFEVPRPRRLLLQQNPDGTGVFASGRMVSERAEA